MVTFARIAASLAIALPLSLACGPAAQAQTLSNEEMFKKLSALAPTGTPEAKYHLGMFLNNGIGTPRDNAAAYKLFAEAAAAEAGLDLARFEEDWDSGRYKASVIADSRRGWHTLKVGGSPTFVLPSGRQISNPAAGDADIDEQRGVVRRYTPYAGDPLAIFRALLDEAIAA